MGWTTERKEILKRMWLAGETSKRISDTLGEVSRNAVMGMVNRMGLMGSAEHNSRMGVRTSGACRPKPVVSPSTAAATSQPLEHPGAIHPVPTAVVGSPPTVETVTPVVAESAPVDLDDAVPSVSVVPESSPQTPAKEVPAEIEETPPWDASPSETVLASGASEAAAEIVVPADPVLLVDPVVTHAAAADPEAPEVATVASSTPEAISETPANDASAEADVVAPRETRKAPDLGNAAPPPSRRRKDADRVQRSPESERRRLVGPLSGLRGPVAKSMAPKVKPQAEPVRVATDGSRPVDWRTALTLVEETTGFPYDPSRPGHRASLVAIGTVLARGDPRRVLSPFLSEPQIISMMRCLAEKGIVVGGKTPQSWLEPEHGDMAFMIDMLVAEGVLDPKARNREMAAAA